MDLVNEQHVAVRQIGQNAGQVAGPFDGRAAGDADVLPHFSGDNARQRSLAQSGRAVKEDMIQRFPAFQRRFNGNMQVLLHTFLHDILPQGLWPQALFLLVVPLTEA